jgi:hypothetical protein
MRHTVTLDPDVETLIREIMRRRDASFKEVVNEGLLAGLEGTSERTSTPFKQKTYHMGQPIVDLTKATALAAALEDFDLASRR